jgi:hypothetical protein
MVARKPDHQGEREAAVKTIARGMPECLGLLVVTCLRAFIFARKASVADFTFAPVLPRVLARECQIQATLE